MIKCISRLWSVIVVALLAGSYLLAGGLAIRGKLTDQRHKAVSGAEVKLSDQTGKIHFEVLSDASGKYRFPVLPPQTKIQGPYQLSISHIRFKPVKDKDVLASAKITSADVKDLVPGGSYALLATSNIAFRDFVLEPSLGTPQVPGKGPVDPNLAEYYYQQALLLLGQSKKKEAVELLTIYAQTGANPRQITRAFQLISQNGEH